MERRPPFSFSPGFFPDFPLAGEVTGLQHTFIEDLREGVGENGSFTRSGAGWYRNASGVWTKETASNAARHHHSASGEPWGVLAEPARTNYFDTPAAPANQTIDLTSAGTGDYTLFIEGSGSVAVAAGTATGTGFGTATEGSPVTFNLTVAGTVTITVTGSPDRANVQKGSYETTFILDAAAPTTRNAEQLTFPGASAMPVNDFSIIIHAVALSVGQGFSVVWDNKPVSPDMAVIWDNTVNRLRFRKYDGGFYYAEDPVSPRTLVAGQMYKIGVRVSSTDGIDIWVDGVKGTNNANTTDGPAATDMYVGRVASGYHFNGAFSNFRILDDPLPDSYMARLTT